MSELCACCGASLPAGSTCQSIHEELLLFELLHAVPHSIHFLHVTCFMIQHGLYSDEALTWAESMLRANLRECMTEEQHFQHLRIVGRSSASGARTWKFTRAAEAAPLSKIAWSLTIVDVAREARTVESYSEQVKAWACAVLQQLAALQSSEPA